MLVYLIAGATFFFYLMMLPVQAGAAWRSGHEARMGITLGPARFSAHIGFQRPADGPPLLVITQDRSGKRREIRLFQGASRPRIPAEIQEALPGAVWFLLRRIRLRRLRAHLLIASNDAAKTALLYGSAQNAFSLMRLLRPDRPWDLRASVNFTASGTQADLCGILSCRLGHIMAAAFVFGRDYLLRRIHTWKSNRSKAS